MRIRLALLFGLLATSAWAQAARQDLSLLAPAEITALQRRLSDAGCYSGPLDGQASAATKAAQQACPDQRPRLVIETGMHIAAISSISADKECKTAVTASYDKTFRLWSLPDGRLLRTMRPPVGDGNLGKFFASGFSPNGRFIAGAGWDALHEAKGDDAVYVFDAATAKRLQGEEVVELQSPVFERPLNDYAFALREIRRMKIRADQGKDLLNREFNEARRSTAIKEAQERKAEEDGVKLGLDKSHYQKEMSVVDVVVSDVETQIKTKSAELSQIFRSIQSLRDTLVNQQREQINVNAISAP